jgi:hypothetical protein
MPGLNSLSVCLIAAHGNPFTGRRQVQLVDAHPGWGEAQFLQDNFGLYERSREAWPMGHDMDDYARCITLTPQRILDDPRLHPKPNGETVTDEVAMMGRIAGQRDLFGMAQLSAWICPRLEMRERREWASSLNFVVGTTFSDRLMFWNARSLMPVWLDDSIVALNVRQEDLAQQNFFDALCQIVKNRTHVTTGSSSQSYVTVRSISVPQAELDALSDRLKDSKIWHIFSTKAVANLDEFVPPARELSNAFRHVERGLPFRPRDWHEVTYTGNSFRPPTVLPRHMREVSPLPVPTRQGAWALDLDIERSTDYSPYSNVRHRWRLPRKLRVIEAFSRGYQLPSNGPFCIPRVSEEALPSFFSAVEGELPEITLPTDDTLFRVGLCTPGSPWPFVHNGERRLPPPAYDMRPSDKGRYLSALLHRAGGLHKAQEIFLRRFWKEQFERVGGTPATTEQRLEGVTRTLRKRLKSGTIGTDDDWERLAKLVLAEARGVRLAQRYLRYDSLEKDFAKYRKAYWERNERRVPQEEWEEEEKRTLSASIQYLCQQEILHQGHEWRCRHCYSNNWVSIDSLQRTLVCDVCGSEEPAPVADVWRFKLDNFIVEGLREHGLLAYIWALDKLAQHAQASFYFNEPHELFYDREHAEQRKPNAEVDLITVADGVVRVCEVKSSDGDIDIQRFAEMALRIRPDIATLAIMGPASANLNTKLTELGRALAGSRIRPELLTLREGDIDDSPHLPSGRSYRVRLF